MYIHSLRRAQGRSPKLMVSENEYTLY